MDAGFTFTCKPLLTPVPCQRWMRSISPGLLSTIPAPPASRELYTNVQHGFLAASLLCLFRTSRSRSPRLGHASVRALASTVLLVDADSHQMHEIRLAMQELGSEDAQLAVTVFAAPGRIDSNKWSHFLQKHTITFQSVKRVGGRVDPNDEAIQSHMRSLVEDPSLETLALLTSDTDFLEVALKTSTKCIRVVVLVPEAMRGTMRKYADAGIEVVPLRRRNGDVAYTVRATLLPDGTGAVKRCKPIPRLPDFREEVEALLSFLTGLGYRSAEGARMLPCVAKCWFANIQKPLTVFPSQAAVMALRAEMQLQHRWAKSAGNLVFVFPCSVSKPPKSKQLELGGTLAFRILQGGGPSMLHDSEELTPQVLSMLGYLDDGLNADLLEALLVFINATRNKSLLKQMDALPRPGQAAADICSKMRRAFLSSRGDGHWQPAPKDGAVRKVLTQGGYLPKTPACPEAVLLAKQRYSRKNMLPDMKTYNGYLWQIMRSINASDPSRRDAIWL
ncbi:unnamed protein product [Symbiodinium natans]|uniref:NYN domain-containing protein n=1 Tax=Symbiodinium natans TaxID=878477 RepID=A0A812SGS8_9DINO|nr:unnamed protein product [Symbiodinium natans]